MTTETAATVTETPAPKKTAKAKTPAKKTTAKAKATAKATSNGKLRGIALAVLKQLAKGKPLSRAKLSEKLDGAWVGSDLMGHFDPKQAKPNSLVSRGYVRYSQPDEEGGAVLYEITAAGRKAIEASK